MSANLQDMAYAVLHQFQKDRSNYARGATLQASAELVELIRAVVRDEMGSMVQLATRSAESPEVVEDLENVCPSTRQGIRCTKLKWHTQTTSSGRVHESGTVRWVD